MKTYVSDLDDVFQFSGLFLDFGSEKQRRSSYSIPVEIQQRMEHVESVHVHDGGVDA